MNWKRRKEVAALADRVRKALKLKGPPYDVRVAVELLGGAITKGGAWDVEACVRKSGDKFLIQLTESASEQRDRFSVAHELGHLFLHMGYMVDPRAWNAINEYFDSPMNREGHSEEELEAHEFAATFLMPEDEFREVARKNLLRDSYNVSEIAKAFDVSVPAARNRGRWLGLFSWDP